MMRKLSARCGALVLLAVTVGVAHAGASSPEDIARQAGVVGLSLATVENGQVVERRQAGVRNADTREPVVAETVFEAASLTKPVVAYTTLRLVDQGVIDLDEPLWSLLPYERLAHDPRARSITARHVLSHTSGLPNWGGTPLEMNFAPGEGWNYSGEGYVFLGQALEVRTGRRLEELVREQCFEPLGMSASSLIWQADYDAVAATGHDEVGGVANKFRPDSENAASSLHTTASDYARFLAAVLAGEGLSPASHRAMTEPATPVSDRGNPGSEDGVRWSLGWGLERVDERWALWHWGDNGTFRAFVWGDPARQRGMVWFTNSQLGLSITDDVLDQYVGEVPHPAVDWLDYWRWDQPEFQERIARRKAFIDSTEAGLSVVRAQESARAEALPEDTILGLAGFLDGRGLADRAIALLESRRPEHDSAALLSALGRARTATGDHAEALADLKAALDSDAELGEALQPRIDWLEAGQVAAERGAPGRTEAELRRLAGVYGPRIVEWEEGGLWYRREGATQRTRLTPLGSEYFTLASSNTFRLGFETDASGRGVAIVGYYADGRTDRSDASP